MIRFPRLAIGSIHRHACPQPMSWAVMGWLTSSGTQVQHFASRCCHSVVHGAAVATGQSSRHLDTWIMSPELCRASFVRGFGDNELAVIDGRFDSARGNAQAPGGSLDTLCQWLEVPRLAVVDCELIEQQGLPARPAVEGLLLDKVSDAADYTRVSRRLQDSWGLPSVGGLERLPRLREAIAALSGGQRLSDEICEQLAAQFGRFADAAAIDRLTRTHDFADGCPTVHGALDDLALADGKRARPITVAVAYDEAFYCYFPDMLDQLEALGATVIDFSPLRDEHLPVEADVVYIGCGNTVHHAAALAQNHCMLSSIRKHLCHGKRLYADGGGLVYLCQSCESESGQLIPLIGALPAIGRAQLEGPKLEPVEVTLARDCWLGPTGSTLRGYLNSHWRIEPQEPLTGYLSEPRHQQDLVGRYSALGSRLQLNFATQIDLLRGFVSPAKAVPVMAVEP
ncbi:MAG: hypothetical protein JNM18_09260 [Planctomycetaceae bacterium]|nr:hypothetical protein [Planctomycetaceae bacterium]